MRTVQVISPRRTPSRSRFVNIMRRAYYRRKSSRMNVSAYPNRIAYRDRRRVEFKNTTRSSPRPFGNRACVSIESF